MRTDDEQQKPRFNYLTKQCEAKNAQGRQCVWGIEHNRNGSPHDFEATPIPIIFVGDED